MGDEEINGWEAQIHRIDQRFEDLRESLQREDSLLKEQLIEYKANVQSRLMEMNEVRKQIYDERGQYQLREKADAQIGSIYDRIARLEREQAAFTGRMIGMGLSLMFFTTLLGLALHFWGKVP